MKKENTEQIRQYILKQIDTREKDYARKTVENFQISKSSVYSYTKKMCDEHILQRAEGKMPPYRLETQEHTFHYENNGTLGEDRIFSKDIEPLLHDCPKNVLSAWRYAFTEMMNNAIEHSHASKILIIVQINVLKTTIIIADNGIGIFKNIQNFIRQEKGEELALEDCVSLLFTGKFTTAKNLHSGEGIFFTSHLMDSFYILSDHIFFSRSSFSDAITDTLNVQNGTAVLMTLSNQSKKNVRKVFDRFSDVEEGFIRTHIPIAHMFPSGSPVSRSEARRLGELISGFKEIDLDFSDVEEVGQAFSHELFIVWQSRNPDVVLNVTNANEAVDHMIRRVKNTQA